MSNQLGAILNRHNRVCAEVINVYCNFGGSTASNVNSVYIEKANISWITSTGDKINWKWLF